MRYVSAKHESPFKEARADMAKLYRDVRKKSPAVARMLWRRQKAATKQIVDQLYQDDPNAPQGLAALIG